MAYNDDAVLAKLSALNETQESIVTVAQWIMFHRYVNLGFSFKRDLAITRPPCAGRQLVATCMHSSPWIWRLIANRRHADRTAQLWLQRLKDSNSNKRLTLIYLANGMSKLFI
jgi:regulator of Ty1 transposition protein 103